MFTSRTSNWTRPGGRNAGSPCASGFTLLEILLALGLSVVLLVAVAAAIDLYRRMTIAGQEDVSEARLVRAVLRKIESDIRSTVPPQAPVTTASDAPAGTTGSTSGTTGGSTAGGTSGSSSASGSSMSSTASTGSSSTTSSSGSTTSSSSTSSSSTSQTSNTDPLQNVNSQVVFGLYGDQRSLVINTLCSHPTPVAPADPSAAQPLNSIHGDLKTVAYFVMGTGGGTPSVALAVGGQSIPTSGLARLEGDHLAVGYAMQQSASLMSAARIIAPEVAMISFRYFDGTQWLMSWDASYMQALPQAVEVTIAVRPTDATGSIASTATTTSSATGVALRQYRHVVAISTSAAPITIQELDTIPTGTTP